MSGHCMTASLGLSVGEFGDFRWRVGPRLRGGRERGGGGATALRQGFAELGVG